MTPELHMWLAVGRLCVEAGFVINYAVRQLIRELKGLA